MVINKVSQLFHVNLQENIIICQDESCILVIPAQAGIQTNMFCLEHTLYKSTMLGDVSDWLTYP
jgi:hypothetical protein